MEFDYQSWTLLLLVKFTCLASLRILRCWAVASLRTSQSPYRMPIKGPTNEFGRKCSLVLPAAVFLYLKQLPVGSIEVNDGEFSNESF